MKTRKFLKCFVLCVVAVNLVIAAYVFLGATVSKTTPMPNPNGFDDFVKAGQMLSGNISGYAKMDKNQLSALISTNEAAIRLLRLGLSRECRAPYDYSSNYVENLMPVFAGFKQSAWLVSAHGKLAEMEDRTNDAAEIYLEGIRFGEECGRGGVILNKLVGVACEHTALRRLALLTNHLDAPHSSDVARKLEDIDAKAEPTEETLAHERNYSQAVGNIMQLLAYTVMYRNMRTVEKSFVGKVNTVQIARHNLMRVFAAHSFELEKGRQPSDLAELVPGYLKAVPRDPIVETNTTDTP